MIVLFSLFYQAIYTKYNGAKSGICHFFNPCNYQVALRKAESGSKILIRDKYLSSKQQIDGFKTIVEKASKINCSVIGRGTIINTISYGSTKTLFEIKDTSKFAISDFSFINIKTSLFRISNVAKCIISNISITSSALKETISLFSAHRSNLVVHNMTINQTTFSNSFLLKMDKSTVLIEDSLFFQNFIFHQTENPYFPLKNSKFIIKGCKFLRTSSPCSPLITALSKTSVSIIDSVFTNENHKDIIKAISNDTNILIQNTTFENNYGTILMLSGTNVKANVNNSFFFDSFGSHYELFVISNEASLSVSYSNFVDNSGAQIFKNSNIHTLLTLNNNNFTNNKNTFALIYGVNKSTNHAENNIFEDNFASIGLFWSDSGKFEIISNTFKNNPATILYSNSSITTMKNNQIHQKYKIEKDWIVSFDSNTEVTGNSFDRKFSDQLMKYNGDFLQQNNIFTPSNENMKNDAFNEL